MRYTQESIALLADAKVGRGGGGAGWWPALATSSKPTCPPGPSGGTDISQHASKQVNYQPQECTLSQSGTFPDKRIIAPIAMMTAIQDLLQERPGKRTLDADHVHVAFQDAGPSRHAQRDQPQLVGPRSAGPGDARPRLGRQFRVGLRHRGAVREGLAQRHRERPSVVGLYKSHFEKDFASNPRKCENTSHWQFSVQRIYSFRQTNQRK